MTLAEQWFDDGLQQGIEQGIEQGLEQGIERGAHQEKIRMVRELLNMGLSEAHIAKVAKVSLDELSELDI